MNNQIVTDTQIENYEAYKMFNDLVAKHINKGFIKTFYWGQTKSFKIYTNEVTIGKTRFFTFTTKNSNDISFGISFDNGSIEDKNNVEFIAIFLREMGKNVKYI